MNGTMVTLVGQVASEVRYTTTVGGVPVASFRLAATDRRYDRQRQGWVDGDTSTFTIWCWRWLAENVLSSISRGDPLLITGRMRVREWDNGPDKPVGVSAEIEAAAVGHDLSRGTSAFRRAVRGRPELTARVPRARDEAGAADPGNTMNVAHGQVRPDGSGGAGGPAGPGSPGGSGESGRTNGPGGATGPGAANGPGPGAPVTGGSGAPERDGTPARVAPRIDLPVGAGAGAGVSAGVGARTAARPDSPDDPQYVRAPAGARTSPELVP
ncbi:single-stranded DNA-binding protein [Streptacidiphilus sp. EB129]|uniref:single-stranded DNA-binding protein n=1 Tax=Streptacidiphilus sp. EB129 TaxID=3156262 RepID=UPI0035189F75